MSQNNDQNSSEIISFQHLDPGGFAIKAIQNDPALQPSTKHQYIKTLENYLAIGEKLTDPVVLTEYALTVGSSPPRTTSLSSRRPFSGPRRCRTPSKRNSPRENALTPG